MEKLNVKTLDNAMILELQLNPQPAVKNNVLVTFKDKSGNIYSDSLILPLDTTGEHALVMLYITLSRALVHSNPLWLYLDDDNNIVTVAMEQQNK